MQQIVEGKTKGAAVRLWSWELPDRFEDLKIGQKILPKCGPFYNQMMRVVGKLHNRFDKFVYCDHVAEDK